MISRSWIPTSPTEVHPVRRGGGIECLETLETLETIETSNARKIFYNSSKKAVKNELPNASQTLKKKTLCVRLKRQDPLDQIDESDSNQPTEVHPTGIDDALSPRQLTGVMGNGPVGEEKPNLPRSRPEVLYFEKGVPLRDSIMWSLQRYSVFLVFDVVMNE